MRQLIVANGRCGSIHIISNVRGALPVYTQTRTYRCATLSDVQGQGGVSSINFFRDLAQTVATGEPT